MLEIFEGSLIPRQIWSWPKFWRISDVDSASVPSLSKEPVKTSHSTLADLQGGLGPKLSFIILLNVTPTEARDCQLQHRHNTRIGRQNTTVSDI